MAEEQTEVLDAPSVDPIESRVPSGGGHIGETFKIDPEADREVFLRELNNLSAPGKFAPARLINLPWNVVKDIVGILDKGGKEEIANVLKARWLKAGLRETFIIVEGEGALDRESWTWIGSERNETLDWILDVRSRLAQAIHNEGRRPAFVPATLAVFEDETSSTGFLRADVSCYIYHPSASGKSHRYSLDNVQEFNSE